jgi:uncharacterized protein YaaN involved in tellurite resistance
LLTGRGEIEEVDEQLAAIDRHLTEASGDHTESLKVIRARRRDLAVQLVVIDQAVAGLRMAAATTETLHEAVDAALRETVLALRIVALAARTLVRRRVILEQIRSEAAVISALAGTSPVAGGKRSQTTSEPASWESLAVAWHRVGRAARAIESLRASVASP